MDFKRATWVSGAAFVALSLAVTSRLLEPLDYRALYAAQHFISGTMDRIGWFFSVLGSIEVTGAVMAVVLAALWLNGRRELAGRALAAFVAVGVIEVGCKLLLPYMTLPEETSRSTGASGIFSIPFPYPYPSGHMLRATFIAGLLVAFSGSRAAYGIAAVVLVGMGVTRVYLGVHWATDVLGGFLLGLAGLFWALSGRRGGKEAWR
jgi:undecaprenyl-diphosphatase